MKLAVKCQYCNKEVALPFKCPFCNQFHCSEHRLPENHKCPEHWRAKAPREQPPTIVVGEAETAPFEYTVSYTPPIPRLFQFSSTEIWHLTLSALLVMAVGLSIAVYWSLEIPKTPEVLVILAIIFALTFLLHELAHKFSAQRFGLWAEFRLTLFGALITTLSIFLPLFKIVSPGAVMIAGSIDKETAGRTAIAGPLTNITLSTIILAFALYPLDRSIQTVAMLSAAWNAWIALVNLIPFGMLDGVKVFMWNKTVWGTTFIASIALTIFTFINLS
jgi:Zn-dependent protease